VTGKKWQTVMKRCTAITAQLKPLAGRVLLPKPAYERFMAQRANV